MSQKTTEFSGNCNSCHVAVVVQCSINIYQQLLSTLRAYDKEQCDCMFLDETPHTQLQFRMKKCSERHKHCVLAVVRWSQKFSPHRRPIPRGAGLPKFNQLEMVTTITYKPSLVRINARNFELSW